ncbi:hypothetical protein, partial [Pseudomonas syringae]|uniref:hypothetical protein n=1 Tax=Pseudomonas syringae TaxID=317 RepID=UPI001C4F8203
GEACSTSLLMGAVFIGHAGNSLRSNGPFTRLMQNCIPKCVPKIFLSIENRQIGALREKQAQRPGKKTRKNAQVFAGRCAGWFRC